LKAVSAISLGELTPKARQRKLRGASMDTAQGAALGRGVVNLSVGLTGRVYLLEIEGLFTQGSRQVGLSAGRSVEFS